jgi:hypothetical protein
MIAATVLAVFFVPVFFVVVQRLIERRVPAESIAPTPALPENHEPPAAP